MSYYLAYGRYRRHVSILWEETEFYKLTFKLGSVGLCFLFGRFIGHRAGYLPCLFQVWEMGRVFLTPTAAL